MHSSLGRCNKYVLNFTVIVLLNESKIWLSIHLSVLFCCWNRFHNQNSTMRSIFNRLGSLFNTFNLVSILNVEKWLQVNFTPGQNSSLHCQNHLNFIKKVLSVLNLMVNQFGLIKKKIEMQAANHILKSCKKNYRES